MAAASEPLQVFLRNLSKTLRLKAEYVDELANQVDGDKRAPTGNVRSSVDKLRFFVSRHVLPHVTEKFDFRSRLELENRLQQIDCLGERPEPPSEQAA